MAKYSKKTQYKEKIRIIIIKCAVTIKYNFFLKIFDIFLIVLYYIGDKFFKIYLRCKVWKIIIKLFIKYVCA